MRASTIYPSSYLKAADLNDQNVRVRISAIKMEEVGDDTKPVLYFDNYDKGLICNKTNWTNVMIAYGDETDDWRGKEIILYPTMVDFQGRSVEAIRVRAPAIKDKRPAPTQATTASRPAPMRQKPVDDDLPDDLQDFSPR